MGHLRSRPRGRLRLILHAASKSHSLLSRPRAARISVDLRETLGCGHSLRSHGVTGRHTPESSPKILPGTREPLRRLAGTEAAASAASLASSWRPRRHPDLKSLPPSALGGPSARFCARCTNLASCIPRREHHSCRALPRASSARPLTARHEQGRPRLQ